MSVRWVITQSCFSVSAIPWLWILYSQSDVYMQICPDLNVHSLLYACMHKINILMYCNSAYTYIGMLKHYNDNNTIVMLTPIIHALDLSHQSQWLLKYSILMYKHSTIYLCLNQRSRHWSNLTTDGSDWDRRKAISSELCKVSSLSLDLALTIWEPVIGLTAM